MLFLAAIICNNQHWVEKLLSYRSLLVISAVVVLALSGMYLRYKPEHLVPPFEVLPFTNKSTLGPVRLIYFFCLVRVVAACWPAVVALGRSKLAKPVVLCGKHSLAVFCLGVLLTITCAALHAVNHLDTNAARSAVLGGVAVSIAFAFVLEQRRVYAQNAFVPPGNVDSCDPTRIEIGSNNDETLPRP